VNFDYYIAYSGGDYALITQVQFMDFLEPRKAYLEWIGFDSGCVNEIIIIVIRL
jgi:hypothetical protein